MVAILSVWPSVKLLYSAKTVKRIILNVFQHLTSLCLFTHSKHRYKITMEVTVNQGISYRLLVKNSQFQTSIRLYLRNDPDTHIVTVHTNTKSNIIC